MALSKDLLIATGLLLICCVVLAVAFTRPDPGLGGSGSSAGTGSHEPPTPPEGLTGPTPPPGGRVDEEPSGIRISEIVDEPDEPVVPTHTSELPDEPVIADLPREQPVPPTDLFPRPRPQTQPEERPEATPVARAWPAGPIGSETRQTPVPARNGGPSRVHEVAAGETLSDIALKYYGTSRDSAWQRIRDANGGVDSQALHVGQKLTIPAATDVVPDREQGQVRADGRSYVVQKGDSYYTIARDQLGNASRFKEIESLNGKDAYELMPGDVIKLPERAGQPTPERPVAAAERPLALPPGARWHVVEEGEVLGTISQRFYGTARRWNEIAAANGIRDPRELRAGARLIIPNAGDGPAPRGATPAAGAPRAETGRRGAGVQHRIASGDRLEDLARRYYGDGGKWRKIHEANPGLHPQRLIVGQSIWIPDAQGASAPAATAPAPARESERPAWPLPSRRTTGESGSSDSGGSDLFRFD